MYRSFLLLNLFVLILSCKNQNSKREDELLKKLEELNEKVHQLEKNNESSNEEINDHTQKIKKPYSSNNSVSGDIGTPQVGSTKYLFVSITINQPRVREIELPESRTFTDDVLGLPSLINTEYIEVPNFRTYYSEIYTVPNYDENKKYRLMDKYQSNIIRDLGTSFHPERGLIEPEIIRKSSYVFDTYEEASRKRSER